jgi:hypothetical protein
MPQHIPDTPLVKRRNPLTIVTGRCQVFFDPLQNCTHLF